MFHEYPYTNFHELNADWLVDTMKKLSSEWDEFHKQLTAEFEEFKNSMNGEWEQFESSLTQAWEKWKAQTTQGLETWKTQTTQDLETWKAQTAKELNDSYNAFTTQVNNAISTFKNEINTKVQGQDTKITALENKVDTFVETLDITAEVDKAFQKLVNEGYVTKLLTKSRNILALIPNVNTKCESFNKNGYKVRLVRQTFSLSASVDYQSILTRHLNETETYFNGEPFSTVIFLEGRDYLQNDMDDSKYIYNFTVTEHCVNLIVVPSSIYIKNEWKSTSAMLLEHYKRNPPNFLFAKNALTLFSDPSQYSFVEGKWIANKGDSLCALLGTAAINAVEYLDVRPELLYPNEINFVLTTTDSPFGVILNKNNDNVGLSVKVRVVYSRKTISFDFVGFNVTGNIKSRFISTKYKAMYIATWRFPGLNDNIIFPASVWLINNLRTGVDFNEPIMMQVGIFGGDSSTNNYPSEKFLTWFSYFHDNDYKETGDKVLPSKYKQEHITDYNFHTF